MLTQKLADEEEYRKDLMAQNEQLGAQTRSCIKNKEKFLQQRCRDIQKELSAEKELNQRLEQKLRKLQTTIKHYHHRNAEEKKQFAQILANVQFIKSSVIEFPYAVGK
jgi:uncharacterized protein VirK/YbjX